MIEPLKNLDCCSLHSAEGFIKIVGRCIPGSIVTLLILSIPGILQTF